MLLPFEKPTSALRSDNLGDLDVIWMDDAGVCRMLGVARP
jgi:hypothetical protein